MPFPPPLARFLMIIDILKRNRFATISVLAAGLIAGLWLVWFLGATRYQDAVDDWIRIGKENGYEISYDRREQFGFPKQTVLRFVNVRWKSNNGIEFHAGDLDISAPLWETQHFKAKFKGEVQIAVPTEDPAYAMVLGGREGQVDVTLTDQGNWEDVDIQMQNAHVGRTPDYVFNIDSAHLNGHRPPVPPENGKSTGLKLEFDASNVALPAAAPASFGPQMQHVQVNVRFLGPIPDFRDKASALAWNKVNGLAEFDRLDVQWGALLMNARGTMDLDDDLQPEGAFETVVGHQTEVLDTLAKNGYIAAAQQDMLASGLRMLAKPAPIGDVQGIEVPIAVQLGGFFFGPVKIFAFPPISWE